LEGLIESLILFSQAEHGEMTLRLAPVDLNKVAEKVLNFSHSKAEEKKIALVSEVQPSLPSTQADEEKLTWVILQLVDNAIKFTASGGRVTLSIQPESEGLIMVSVSDTGIGIPSDRMEEIFEPFHQLDNTSTRRYGGTGLGLALVRDIINSHGSMVEVQSEEQKGSTFRFPLLAADSSKKAAKKRHG
jgi:two-component system phosphate regulon sensor histidine kinase PhoR